MAWVGIIGLSGRMSGRTRSIRDLVGRLKNWRHHSSHRLRARLFKRLGYFVQYYGGDTLDASLLLLPLVGFLPADDPRIRGTIAAIERDLMDGGLVRRKARSPDGPDEGAFLACSCWLADCYRLQGRDPEAVALLERVIAVANDVGLLSEEYPCASRALVGNIPQAFTHLALVNTALLLSGPRSSEAADEGLAPPMPDGGAVPACSAGAPR